MSLYHLKRLVILTALFVTQLFAIMAYSQEPPTLLLAQNYHQGIDVKKYLISEKFDGVRACWDGKQLISRQGNIIHAPDWFTKSLPKVPLDGELWMGRGQFEALSGAVRKDTAMDSEWKNIHYQVFELPNASGTFQERFYRIETIVQQAKFPQLIAAAQFRLKDEASLKLRLNQVVKNGGEGLMLHRADALYTTGRSDVMLKLKPLYDAEAKVVGHSAGKGKYAGKLGALLVETPSGVRFKLGTGFSDAQREYPPKIGSIVTYTFKDTTKYGKPKFASFLRVREE